MKTLGEVKAILETIKTIDLNEEDSFDRIVNIIEHDLEKFALPSIELDTGVIIFRSREHSDENDFVSINQISYRTDTENIKNFGRANVPNQSIFYAGDIRPTAIAETCKVFREENPSEEEFEVTTGRWESTGKIKMSLFISKNSQESNELLRQYGVDIEELTKEMFPETHQQISEIVNFISDEFANNTNGNDNLYKISSAFAQYAFETSDGVIFPSLQRIYQGTNFALKPEIIDEKFNLTFAIKDKFEKTDTHEFVNTEHKEVTEIIDNKIVWDETVILVNR
jgi:hypothetical protein